MEIESEKSKKIDVFSKYINEFDKEIENNSDRGIVLICGSILEKMLEDLLKTFFVKGNKIDNKLFSNKAPLGTLDAKKETAFFLGLISKEEVSNIKLIQKVRNQFAHEIIDISFTSNKIESICSNFKIPKNSYLPDNISLLDNKPDKIPFLDLNPIKKDTIAKDRFLFAFHHLIQQIFYRTFIEPHVHSREEYKKSSTVVDVLSRGPWKNIKVDLERIKESNIEVNKSFTENLSNLENRLKQIKDIKDNELEEKHLLEMKKTILNKQKKIGKSIKEIEEIEKENEIEVQHSEYLQKNFKDFFE